MPLAPAVGYGGIKLKAKTGLQAKAKTSLQAKTKDNETNIYSLTKVVKYKLQEFQKKREWLLDQGYKLQGQGQKLSSEPKRIR